MHSVIQRTLHWKPGRTNQLPSAGATYQDKQADGTYTTVEIRVPDWDMGPKSNENANWMQDIKREVKAGIVEVSHELFTDVNWHHLHTFRILGTLVTNGPT